jgi:CBS domain-containing protein
MKARDVMTTYPSVVLPDETTIEAARIMRDRNVNVLPVVGDLRNRALVGILTDRDLVVRCMAAGHDGACLVREHMTTAPLIWVGPDADVREVAAKMAGHTFRRIPVLDHGRRLVGVVALADLDVKARATHPVLVEDVERYIYPPPEAFAR